VPTIRFKDETRVATISQVLCEIEGGGDKY
jgi:hypothetical protein